MSTDGKPTHALKEQVEFVPTINVIIIPLNLVCTVLLKDRRSRSKKDKILNAYFG